MRVEEVMTVPAQTCRPTSDLGEAAKTMMEHECGCLAVVDSRGHIVGMITDRDICLAVAARHKNPWDIPVRDAMSPQVFSCTISDDVRVALATMREHHVHRLPAVDANGHLMGVLSLDDLVNRAGEGPDKIPVALLLETFQGVCPPKLRSSEPAVS